MSLRIQMLQVARRGASQLGDAAESVRSFLRSHLHEGGAGVDRDGRPDLYYTIFSLAGMQALDEEIPVERVRSFLLGFGEGDGLDFVHLGALVRCWSVVGGLEARLRDGMLARIEGFRARDGGYDGTAGAAHGNAYGCFVAMGAYQDAGVDIPRELEMVRSLKFLETPDGAWGNAPRLKMGSTNATAAAVTLLHQLGMPVAQSVGEWLLKQMHPQGGFLAMPRAPLPDLLSTATSLHALACLETTLSKETRELCLDFLDSLWTAEGGFHGHWADDMLDAEYTFYGLLALGHLS